MDNHDETQTKVEKVFKCDICEKDFLNRKCLKNHMKLHDKWRNYQCAVCDEIFKKKYNLQQHKKWFHENEGKYRCDICESGFLKIVFLKEHYLKTHEYNNNVEQCGVVNPSWSGG